MAAITSLQRVGAFSYTGKIPGIVEGALGEYRVFLFPYHLFDTIDCKNRLKAVSVDCFFGRPRQIAFVTGTLDGTRVELVVALQNVELIKSAGMVQVVLPVYEGVKNFVGKVENIEVGQVFQLADPPDIRPAIAPPSTIANVKVEPPKPEVPAPPPESRTGDEKAGAGKGKRRGGEAKTQREQELSLEDLVAMAGRIVDDFNGKISFPQAERLVRANPNNQDSAVRAYLESKGPVIDLRRPAGRKRR